MDLGLKPSSSSTTTSSSSALWHVDMRKRHLVSVDMLSNLPDELLIMILSFLPTKDAAAVCLLSKRLWSVFPWITSLDFDGSPISYCVKNLYGIELFPIYVSFVDSVLNGFASKHLTRFRLVVGPDFCTRDFNSKETRHHGGCKYNCLPDLKSTQINDWITFALTYYGLRELDLCIQVKNSRQRQLPPAIFTCGTLEVLRLSFNLALNKAFTIPICLPNLKILKFHTSAMCMLDDGFMTRLVSSCPLLEDVTWETHWNLAHSISLSSTSLRRLCLTMHHEYTFAKTHLVHIDTPNLQYIEYSDNLSMRYSIPAMNHLIEANINIRNDHLFVEGVEYPGEKMLSLIKPLCSVHHLTLRSSYLKDLNFCEVNNQLPVFHNLKQLELGPIECSYWNEVLSAFLNRSPVLETLVFPEGLNVGEFGISDSCFREHLHLDNKKFCRATQTRLHYCYNLKRIEIKNCFGKECEVDLTRFMLRHAMVFEQLIICRCQKAGHSFADQLALDNILYIPRASIKCSIQMQ